ncbi:MAG: isoamylase early set domain-containing protein [Gemmatimonadaceae bacterium]|nr:isoamylase early set domain-containing protein [Gemmatimonadaceae bacterium]
MTDDEMNAGDMDHVEMPDVANDETLRDVVAALSALPVVKESDIQAIVARAAAQAAEGGRRTGRGSSARPNRDPREPAGVIPLRPSRPRWFTSIPLAAAAALVLAAGIGGFLLSNAVSGRGTTGTTGTTGATGTGGAVATFDAAPAHDAGSLPVSTVAADPSAEAPVVTQFVLDAPAAAAVSLVGAFNGWDADATPLVRDAATGLWTVSLPLAPGRHVYAFMVNDSTLTLDPRAPATSDPELGAIGSVILVGTP